MCNTVFLACMSFIILLQLLHNVRTSEEGNVSKTIYCIVIKDMGWYRFYMLQFVKYRYENTIDDTCHCQSKPTLTVSLSPVKLL